MINKYKYNFIKVITFPDTVSPSKYIKLWSFLLFSSSFFFPSGRSKTISNSAVCPSPKKVYNNHKNNKYLLIIIILFVVQYNIVLLSYELVIIIQILQYKTKILTKSILCQTLI